MGGRFGQIKLFKLFQEPGRSKENLSIDARPFFVSPNEGLPPLLPTPPIPPPPPPNSPHFRVFHKFGSFEEPKLLSRSNTRVALRPTSRHNRSLPPGRAYVIYVNVLLRTTCCRQIYCQSVRPVSNTHPQWSNLKDNLGVLGVSGEMFNYGQ